MRNKEVAELLLEIAKLLELKGENTFRIRAFEKAAQSISSLPQPIEDVIQTEQIQNLPGVGTGITQRIKQYLEKGRLDELENLKKQIPEGLLKIISIPGVGPKSAKIIYEKLKITSVEELKKAALEGKLTSLPHFGKKTEENILKGIELLKQEKGRILLNRALMLANQIINQLKSYPHIKKINMAGSLRRKKETIGDIDILCSGKNRKAIMDKFTHLPVVKEALVKGETKSSIITKDGVQVDLRVIDENSYGAALLYFTGSKEHNITLRELAIKKGYKINEYGLYRLKKTKEEFVYGKDEEGIYNRLGLQYIYPELRENRNEIETARKRKIPTLIIYSDLKGDLHVHSKYSDGSSTINEIVEKAKALGFKWVGIADHSKSLKVANGLSEKVLLKKIEEINKFNSKNKDFKILCATEVDILSDGSLDYSDDILKRLDLVIAAIHTGFKQNEKQITKRIIKAMKNKYVNIISHPTGRLIGKREAYALNIEEFLKVAKDTNTFIEINAYPERLDLYDIYCKKAKEMGVYLSIGSDAHFLEQMEYIYLGVDVARRGWLEKDNVINTLEYSELIKKLREKR